jgi:hypothetical protein
MDASHKHSKLPHIQILDLSVDSEKSIPNISFEVNDAFLDMIKEEKNVKNISQEYLSGYVYNLLENCANEKDDYSYKTSSDIEVSIDKTNIK